MSKLTNLLSQIGFHKPLYRHRISEFNIHAAILKELNLLHFFQIVDRENVFLSGVTEQFREPLRATVQMPNIKMDKSVQDNA